MSNDYFFFYLQILYVGELDNVEAQCGVVELRQKIDGFRDKIGMRSHLLFLAYNFFLHYDEITEW